MRAWTASLERVHRAALPNAVRFTLNDAAFEARLMIPESAKDEFEVRREAMFNRLAFVKKAGGFDIDKMEASVGIKKGVSRLDHVAEGLATQETGGTVQKPRSFIPLQNARKGKNHKNLVRPAKRIGRIDGVRRVRGRGDKQALYAAALSHQYVIYTKNRTTLFEVRARKGEIKMTPLYQYKKDHKITVDRSPFVQNAALTAAKRLAETFEKNARKQLEKYRYR
jgi:hypothetical protein